MSFFVAAMVTLSVTPTMRRLAWRVGFVDSPDKKRKKQEKPVALGGGIVVATGLLASVGVCSFLYPHIIHQFLMAHGRFALAAIVFTVLLIVAVGLIDDRFGMRGRHKLFFQLIAATVVLAGCMTYTPAVSLLGIEIPMGVFGVVVALSWVVTSVNAFNLIDGVDGLASSMGIVIGISLGTVALLNGSSFDAIIAFGLSGALVAFLLFNRQPASMYLGDAGSMMLGLVLGSVALRCSGPGVIVGAPLLAIWSILIFDLVSAVVRRKLTGRSIYDCDRGHFHHRMISKGLSPNQTALSISGLTALISFASVIGVWLNRPNVGIFVAAISIAVLVRMRVFGHTEASLINQHVRNTIQESLRPSNKRAQAAAFQLQGKLDWKCLWETVVDHAEDLSLSKVSLNLHVATDNEDFFASWSSAGSNNDEVVWEINQPFIKDEQVIGKIVATSRQTNHATEAQIRFLRFTESLAPKIRHLVDSGVHRIPAPKSKPIVDIPIVSPTVDTMSM